MNISKRDQKYQAKQQLEAKFKPQICDRYGFYWTNPKVDVTELLKKVVR